MSQVGLQLFVGTIMVTITIIFHIGCFVGMAGMLKRYATRKSEEGKSATASAIVLLVFTALFVLGVHIFGIWLWAGLFLYLDILHTLESALYFSTVTSTTVGYGDVVLGPDWRLLGSIQGMGGIILFGISTAFVVAVSRTSLRQYFAKPGD